MNLIDIFRTLHPPRPEYIFFSSAHGIFSKIDCILEHKTSLDRFKRIEIISIIFSDHNTMKLEINYGKRNKKKKDSMEIKQYATKKPMSQ